MKLGGLAILNAFWGALMAVAAHAENAFPGLDDSLWRVETADVPVAGQDGIILTMDHESIRASYPCGWVGYTFEPGATPGSVVTSNRYGSETHCAQGDLEGLARWLANIKSFRRDGDRLLLFDAQGGSIALLARMKATGIENRRWWVVSYEVGRALRPISVEAPARPWIRFDNGDLDGSLGCGGVIATYRLSEGNRLSIGHAGWILLGVCAGPLDAMFHQNDVFGDVLSRVGRVDVLGNQAVLRSGEGEALVVLSAE